MLDLADFFEPEGDLERDAAKPTCPECHLMLPVTGVCC